MKQGKMKGKQALKPLGIQLLKLPEVFQRSIQNVLHKTFKSGTVHCVHRKVLVCSQDECPLIQSLDFSRWITSGNGIDRNRE